MIKTSDNLSAAAQRKIGAHVSAAGGHYKALQRAAEIGSNCVQLFSGSPRVWKKPALESIDVDKINSERKKLSVEPIFTHSLYLVNLASDKPEILQKSIDSVLYELQFDALISGAGVVVHIGSHQGRGFAAVESQLVETLAHILERAPKNSRLLIENAASRNGKIGGELTEIARLLNALETRGSFVSQGRIGWCLDTCHAHASGYVIAAEPRGEHLSAVAQITELDLWPSLCCIHANDSKDTCGSYRDRHENMGEGTIPPADFRAFFARPEVAHIPIITEAPGFDGNGPDRENIKRLWERVG